MAEGIFNTLKTQYQVLVLNLKKSIINREPN